MRVSWTAASFPARTFSVLNITTWRPLKKRLRRPQKAAPNSSSSTPFSAWTRYHRSSGSDRALPQIQGLAHGRRSPFARSVGKRGTGIEEHFGIDPKAGLIDIKMGTLSKTIPSIGGYIACNSKLVNYLRHSIRPFIFSAALPPASAAAAKAAFEVIEEEPWRVKTFGKTLTIFLKHFRRADLTPSAVKPPSYRLCHR